jgi:hypothetical protein
MSPASWRCWRADVELCRCASAALQLLAVYHSRGEFDVQFADLLSATERLCDERSRDQALAGARHSLLLLRDRFKRGEKLPEKERRQLTGATEILRRVSRGDEKFHDQIADIEDFIDEQLTSK